MQLRDLISNENGYQVPFVLEQCFSDDPRYVPCHGEIQSIDLNNARLNLEKIRTGAANLDLKRFPADLSPVVLYLRQIQEFALWKDTQQLAFFQTGDLRQLEERFRDINPKTSCKTVLDYIREAHDKQQAQGLARHYWANCVFGEERKQIGLYPHRKFGMPSYRRMAFANTCSKTKFSSRTSRFFDGTRSALPTALYRQN